MSYVVLRLKPGSSVGIIALLMSPKTGEAWRVSLRECRFNQGGEQA